MRIHRFSALLAGLAFLPGQAVSQSTVYGTIGKWVVTQSDGKQCWLVRGTSESLFAITLNRDGFYGVAFSVKRSTPVPAVIPVAINAMDLAVSKDAYRIEKMFTNVINRGTERFYQARLSDGEADTLVKRSTVTFTELVRGKNAYSHISAAHQTIYEPGSMEMLRKCISEL